MTDRQLSLFPLRGPHLRKLTYAELRLIETIELLPDGVLPPALNGSTGSRKKTLRKLLQDNFIVAEGNAPARFRVSALGAFARQLTKTKGPRD
jgi:hypothetical protein